jgi:hypothetical protein
VLDDQTKGHQRQARPVKPVVAEKIARHPAFLFNKFEGDVAPDPIQPRWAKDILKVFWFGDTRQFGQFSNACQAGADPLPELHNLQKPDEGGQKHRKGDGNEGHSRQHSPGIGGVSLSDQPPPDRLAYRRGMAAQ